jgi:hypothetical protein
MKGILAIPMLVLAGLGTASAQSASPYYDDNSIHQSAGDRDSRGYLKYHQRPSQSRNRAARATTGSRSTTGYGRSYGSSYEYAEPAYGSRPVPPQGPYYDYSIHQSGGRSRLARLPQILRAPVAAAGSEHRRSLPVDDASPRFSACSA